MSVPENHKEIIESFILDYPVCEYRFLEREEQEGRVDAVGDDLPRSFVLANDREGIPRIYLTPLSPAALSARGSRNSFE